ncbi:MAG: hypothetical protein GTO76_12965, partial [Planctomycetales bacterium]|nr:hypothetical protein [Planctomycetales bacterium]NIN78631.1 hypothetical protein [Planctomycetales bacterium]NIP05699.1 hypothetical protein [Planctomycetales bacterium]NIP71116.1 hypothetical protein [Planctomycetales bacterium]
MTFRWDEALTEWYFNDARGLEQGFTLARPPTPSPAWVREGVPPQRLGAGDSLVLEMGIATDLRPRLTADGQAVLFADASGQSVLRYADLHVTDATGHVFPARLEMDTHHVSRITDHALRIVIDDAGAAYPLTVDPLLASQVAKLIAADGEAGDLFGNFLLLSGDTVVVGARYADIGGNSRQGAAYVFYRDQGGTDAWGQVKKLTAADGAAGDWFGYIIKISRDIVVVATPFADVGGNYEQGTAYVFYRDWGGANNWGQVKKLTADDGAA